MLPVLLPRYPSNYVLLLLLSIDVRYPKLKSQLRAEVYHTLEDKSFIASEDANITEKPRDVYLASELIRELLMSFGLNNSLSVFNEEMGQPAQMAVDRYD